MSLNDDVWGLVLEYALDWQETHRRRLKRVHESLKDHLVDMLDLTLNETHLFEDVMTEYGAQMLHEACFRSYYHRLRWLAKNGTDLIGNSCITVTRMMLPNPIYVAIEEIPAWDGYLREMLGEVVVENNGEQKKCTWLMGSMLADINYSRGYSASQQSWLKAKRWLG